MKEGPKDALQRRAAAGYALRESLLPRHCLALCTIHTIPPQTFLSRMKKGVVSEPDIGGDVVLNFFSAWQPYAASLALLTSADLCDLRDGQVTVL